MWPAGQHPAQEEQLVGKKSAGQHPAKEEQLAGKDLDEDEPAGFNPAQEQLECKQGVVREQCRQPEHDQEQCKHSARVPEQAKKHEPDQSAEGSTSLAPFTRCKVPSATQAIATATASSFESVYDAVHLMKYEKGALC